VLKIKVLKHWNMQKVKSEKKYSSITLYMNISILVDRCNTSTINDNAIAMHNVSHVQ
jgi:phage pi2 protein 07